MNEYFIFLSEREGASDSDVDALEKTFGLPTYLAVSMYCRWLDSLVGEST